MAREAIKRYSNSSTREPFFAAVGDEEYGDVKTSIVDLGFRLVRLSEFCHGADLRPDLDELRTYLHELQGARVALLGLGEYLTLCGTDEARRVLASYKTFALNDSKVVFLLRGVHERLTAMGQDLRFDGRRYFVSSRPSSALEFQLYDPELTLEPSGAFSGFKEALSAVEEDARNAEGRRVYAAKSQLRFPNALYNVRTISSAYDALLEYDAHFPFAQGLGTEKRWTKFYRGYVASDGDVDKTLRQGGVDEVYEPETQLNKAFEERYVGWLHFLALQSRQEKYAKKRPYLHAVLSRAKNPSQFKKCLLTHIREKSTKANDYWGFYNERKDYVKKYFEEPDLVIFLNELAEEGKEGVWRLTDCTKAERRKIVEHYCRDGQVAYLERLYPALDDYRKKYQFPDGARSEELTEYFERYKELKLSNRLDDAFLALVNDYGKTRIYNDLPSRNETVERQSQNERVWLYWLDAFGVEYLSFVAEYCRQKDLLFDVYVSRADVPTITSVNRGFFEDWDEKRRFSNRKLDDVKHDRQGEFNSKPLDAPLHLVDELEVVRGALDRIFSILGSRDADAVVLASDHGASRLAVLHKPDEKYDAGSKGEHSGRCCPATEEVDLVREFPTATEENGWYVLADYGRFKWSRAANVEVHGGASLEEVVVPTIVFRLRQEEEAVVKFVRLEGVQVSPRDPLTIEFYSVRPLSGVYVEIVEGAPGCVRAETTTDDQRLYRATFPTIKKAGTYKVAAFENGEELATATVKATGKGVKTNSDFDDFFGDD